MTAGLRWRHAYGVWAPTSAWRQYQSYLSPQHFVACSTKPSKLESNLWHEIRNSHCRKLAEFHRLFWLWCLVMSSCTELYLNSVMWTFYYFLKSAVLASDHVGLASLNRAKSKWRGISRQLSYTSHPAKRCAGWLVQGPVVSAIKCVVVCCEIRARVRKPDLNQTYRSLMHF